MAQLGFQVLALGYINGDDQLRQTSLELNDLGFNFAFNDFATLEPMPAGHAIARLIVQYLEKFPRVSILLRREDVGGFHAQELFVRVSVVGDGSIVCFQELQGFAYFRHLRLGANCKAIMPGLSSLSDRQTTS